MNLVRPVCTSPLSLLRTSHFEAARLLNWTPDQNHSNKRFGNNWTYCMRDPDFLYGVKGNESVLINLVTFEVRSLGVLHTCRTGSGMISLNRFIYAFGGCAVLATSSCEKYSISFNTWTVLGDLHHPKYHFTPCHYNDEVYLCSLDLHGHPFEEFQCVTETVRCLPFGYQSQSIGSVSFVVKNTLYVVGVGGVLMKWKLLKSQLEPTQQVNLHGISYLARSNIPPVLVGKRVYWVGYASPTLVIFNPAIDKIQINSKGSMVNIV